MFVYLRDISTSAARITELDIAMFHGEFWKSVYSGVKGQGYESQKNTDGMDFCTLVNAVLF